MRSRNLTGLTVALAVALSILVAAPAVGWADENIGSTLASEPTVTKEPTGGNVDTVYWLKTLANGQSAAMTAAGTVKSVTIKGYALESGLLQKIFIQVLRPQPNGQLLVVATSQPFELPTTPGTYPFEPTNMMVQPGDFIGIATVGGTFKIASGAAGAVTDDFSGHNKDMNGDEVYPTKVEENVELLVQVKFQSSLKTEEKPKETPKTEEKKKKKKEPPSKKCKCLKLTVELDKTLVKKRLPSNKHKFGVGFTWRMTCTEGKGGCEGKLRFLPPEILAGTLPKTKGLKLNLYRTTFLCKTACKTSTQGRFEIKMSSPSQLNKLFGRTLAFSINAYCDGTTFRYLVNVPVSKSGRLQRSTLTFTKVP